MCCMWLFFFFVFFFFKQKTAYEMRISDWSSDVCSSDLGELDLARMLMRRLMLTGSTLRARSAEFKTMVADELSRNVWPLIDSGEFSPVMDRVFPLAEAAAAHARMEAGEHIGKSGRASGRERVGQDG